MKRNLFFLLAVIFVFSIFAAGCGGTTGGGNDNEIVVASEAAFPPFEKVEAGKVVGLDIDIIDAVAAEVGLTVKHENTTWDPLFEGVSNGTYDAGISAITITEDRKKDWSFSDPYFEATQMIMVPEGSNVSSMKDIEGMKIGVQTGTTGEAAVKKAFGEQYKNLLGYEDYPSAIEDLFNGRVEAVVGDNAVLMDYKKNFPDKKIKLVEDPSFEKEEYGIMVQKGNDELLKKLNEGLKKIKENGKYDEIMKKWLGE